jgi:hypothetical protein
MKLGITPSTQSLEVNSPVSRRPEQAPIERPTILLSRLPVTEKERRLTNYKRWMLAFSMADAFLTLLLILGAFLRFTILCSGTCLTCVINIILFCSTKHSCI